MSLEYRCAGIKVGVSLGILDISLISLDITGILPMSSPIQLTTQLLTSQSVTIRYNPSYNSYDKE